MFEDLFDFFSQLANDAGSLSQDFLDSLSGGEVFSGQPIGDSMLWDTVDNQFVTAEEAFKLSQDATQSSDSFLQFLQDSGLGGDAGGSSIDPGAPDLPTGDSGGGGLGGGSLISGIGSGLSNLFSTVADVAGHGGGSLVGTATDAFSKALKSGGGGGDFTMPGMNVFNNQRPLPQADVIGEVKPVAVAGAPTNITPFTPMQLPGAQPMPQARGLESLFQQDPQDPFAETRSRMLPQGAR